MRPGPVRVSEEPGELNQEPDLDESTELDWGSTETRYGPVSRHREVEQGREIESLRYPFTPGNPGSEVSHSVTPVRTLYINTSRTTPGTEDPCHLSRHWCGCDWELGYFLVY